MVQLQAHSIITTIQQKKIFDLIILIITELGAFSSIYLPAYGLYWSSQIPVSFPALVVVLPALLSLDQDRLGAAARKISRMDTSPAWALSPFLGRLSSTETCASFHCHEACTASSTSDPHPFPDLLLLCYRVRC